MFTNIGLPEVIVIAVILFFLFGGKKMVELARGLGESTKEIKKAKKEFDKAVKEETEELKDSGQGGGK